MELYEVIIYKYVELLNDYLQHMKQSETLKSIPNSTYIICIGLNAILHIFKIFFHNTKNIETTYYHCQKASYCYLEYIEQMNKTFSLHNLNNLDAITFIYKNALVDVQMIPPQAEDRVPPGFALFSQKTSDIDSSLILKNISLITKKLILFSDELELETEETPFTDNGVDQLSFIINHFLKRFFVLTFVKDQSYLFDYIKQIKIALQMDFQEYGEFLKQVYRVLKKSGSIPTEEKLREKYIELFVNRENRGLMERLKNEKKMEEITKMMFFSLQCSQR
jgi:hypothetical protein